VVKRSLAIFGAAWHDLRRLMAEIPHVPTPASPKEAFTLSKHRIEGLSDGLFAIVMTLLVLDLKVPQFEGHVGGRDLLHALGSNWRVFFSLCVTFCLAAVYWFVQQRIFTAMRAVDRASMFFSLASMLFVSLLPFAAAVFGRYSNNPTALALYFGDQFGIAFFIALLWNQTIRTNNLVALEKADQTRMSVRVNSLAVAAFAAVWVGIYKPQYAAFGFIGVLLAGRLYRRAFLHL
jgi:uncharacterized membrane protein